MINDCFNCFIQEPYTIYDFNGTLSFLLKKQAKSDTGMLFLIDKSYLVTISRRGVVKSMDTTMAESEMKRNDHLNFS